MPTQKQQKFDTGDVWRWVDFKANLGLLSVVNSKTFENEHTHTRSSSSTNRVGCHETLDVFGVVYELSESVADDRRFTLCLGTFGKTSARKLTL